MGPYYDSIGLMVRPLPEPANDDRAPEGGPDEVRDRVGQEIGEAPRRRPCGRRASLFGELYRILRQPVPRAWRLE